MNTERLINDKLDEIADKNYAENAAHFKDKAHFTVSLKWCYALVANRTCQEWNALNGIDHRLTKEDFISNFKSLAFGLDNAHIHSASFKMAVGSFRQNGRKAIIPYSKLLKILSDGGIIHANHKYSSGKDSDGHDVSAPFSKSYSLDSRFMFEVIERYIDGKAQTEPFDIYKCFCAYYPNKLLDSKIKEAKALYVSQTETEGIKVILPCGWENKISPFGSFTFDEELSIDKLIRGLKAFRTHKMPKYKGDRFYDWFTSCSSAFREYLYKDGKHYRELIDCHSGIFWMFALYGYKNGRIDKEECQRMIEHCFKGSFYSDLSNREKSKDVKRVFMKVLNMSRGQEHYMEATLKDPLFIQIHRGLSKCYPQWTAYLASLKKRFNKKIGKHNHFKSISIERDIMDELKNRLESRGHTDLRRVHDAMYGLENVTGIKEILHDVVMDYFNAIRPRAFRGRTL